MDPDDMSEIKHAWMDVAGRVQAQFADVLRSLPALTAWIVGKSEPGDDPWLFGLAGNRLCLMHATGEGDLAITYRPAETLIAEVVDVLEEGPHGWPRRTRTWRLSAVDAPTLIVRTEASSGVGDDWSWEKDETRCRSLALAGSQT